MIARLFARLLVWLPSLLTGRIGPRAEREVRGWTKGNATLRTLRYGWVRRVLLWGADHPVIFGVLVAAASAGVAYCFTSSNWRYVPQLHRPELKDDFDLAAFTGVPWSVQATLVALVYPIVLASMALMLQRKAHSTVALRVYVLDSAVVPAGASAIGLLLLMGLQYFAVPYASAEFLCSGMAALLILNGTWLAANLLLTAHFLSRTVRFIQEEDQLHAYTRVAVSVVLRAELTAAAKQHMFVNAPRVDWGATDDDAEPGKPRVQMFASGKGKPEVRRDLKGSQVLHDVHLRLLGWVVRSWRRRAIKCKPQGKNVAPVIQFPPKVGLVASEEAVLCFIQDGPPLTPLESWLVRAAFVYRPSREGTLSLTVAKMLEELVAGVEAAAEQRRFGAAEAALRQVVKLHKTLLLACAADSEGVAENAATIGTSPYAWGQTSFAMEWLGPYREVARLALAHLEEDSRLFRVLAVVPASIAGSLPPKPEKLAIDAMVVGSNLVYQLAQWWTRKADASLASGATSFSGTLPAPLSKVYEQALISFVGSWGHLDVHVPDERTGDPADTWSTLTARAHVYAKHIESCAQMLLHAVSRGDEAASVWFADNFIKWWGNRELRLEGDEAYPEDFPNASLALADKSWEEAKTFLWTESGPPSVDVASKALSLGIRRYWESMRMLVVLLLVQNSGTSPTSASRELRIAAALVKGTALRRGGSVEFWAIDDVESFSTAFLELVFGTNSPVRQVDAFAEEMDRQRRAPEVSGWIYGWSGGVTNVQSMKHALLTVLAALAAPRGPRIGANKKLIESWWRDLEKLQQVAAYLWDLRREVLSADFKAANNAIEVLQEHFNVTRRVCSARAGVSRTLKLLSRVASFERTITLRSLDVDEAGIRQTASKLGTDAFGEGSLPSWAGASPCFVPGLANEDMSLTFQDRKERYVVGATRRAGDAVADGLGEHVRRHALAWAFRRRAEEAGLSPVNSPEQRKHYGVDASERQTFISALVARADAIRAAGDVPIVLVGRTAVRYFLSPQKWGPESWQVPLPAGISIRAGERANGETADAFVNGTEVHEFDTPNGDCYVVATSLVKPLEVGGTSAESAVALKWTQLNDEQLSFILSWRAQLR